MLPTLLLLLGGVLSGSVVLAVARRKLPSPEAPMVAPATPAPVATPRAAPPPARPALLQKDLLLDRMGGDLDLLGELAAMLRKDTPARLHLMREAARAGDAATLARATHALRGAVGNLCAPDVFRAATELEEACRSGRVDGTAMVAVDALGRDVENLHVELDLLLRTAA